MFSEWASGDTGASDPDPRQPEPRLSDPGRSVMDLFGVIKAGFMGFALAVGVLMLVFFVAGTLLGVTTSRFGRIFLVGGIAAFAAVYGLLRFKIGSAGGPEALEFLVGCVGGWLGGMISGLVQMRQLLLGFLKPGGES